MMQLPEEFVERTRALMGEELFARFLQGLDEEPPVTIRLNPLKCYHMPLRYERRVPWCDAGFYLNERPQFTFDPMFHAGQYYVQEASSMFIHEVLRQQVTKPILMLDLCAAPGGKSTAARTRLPHGSVLVCNEPIRQRAQVLTENIQKFGHRDVIVTNNLPRDFRKSGLTFDVVLCDVPCSGEGMFRRDEVAIAEWTPQNVEKCWRLQREIVSDIWPQLRDGGLLIYSTCTFNTLENEQNVRWICEELGAELVPVRTQPEWNITGFLLPGFDGPVYRFIPGMTCGEGLFVAVMRKNPSLASPRTSAPPHLRTPAPPKGLSQNLANVLCGDFTFHQEGERLIAISATPLMAATYAAARKALKVLHAGVTVGTMKGRDLIPHPSLSLAASLNKDAYPRVELTYQEAISYLRGESLTLPADTPRGFVIVTYYGVSLGFVKNIGTRANNLYPDGWRIKSTHLPAEPPQVLDL